MTSSQKAVNNSRMKTATTAAITWGLVGLATVLVGNGCCGVRGSYAGSRLQLCDRTAVACSGRIVLLDRQPFHYNPSNSSILNVQVAYQRYTNNNLPGITNDGSYQRSGRGPGPGYAVAAGTYAWAPRGAAAGQLQRSGLGGESAHAHSVRFRSLSSDSAESSTHAVPISYTTPASGATDAVVPLTRRLGSSCPAVFMGDGGVIHSGNTTSYTFQVRTRTRQRQLDDRRGLASG